MISASQHVTSMRKMSTTMQKWIVCCFLLFTLSLVKGQGDNATVPIVIWHGMGDSCCNPLSIGYLMDLLKQQLPGVYVLSIKIGDNIVEDTYSGFIGNANDQISKVCEQLANDSKLQQGYNAIGFSQGGQFLRAIAQRCPKPPMRNLISIGGQHQGVYGFPRCPGTNITLCDYVRKMLNLGAYISFIQDHVIQAEYWHDPMNEAEYREKSIFLADINQEQQVNQTYRTNLMQLKNFVMVKFLKDTMVQPKESEWFGFYNEGQSNQTYTLQESTLYKEDKLGLQKMDRAGKLHFLTSDTDHLQFTDTWFTENIVKVFL